MESKFIIFVVFAAVVQSSFTLQSSSVYEAEIEANFSVIQSGQDTTFADFDTAFNGIFDIIEKFVNVSLGNEKDTENLISTTKAINYEVFDAFVGAYVASRTAIEIVQVHSSTNTTSTEIFTVKLPQVVNGTYDAILLSTNSSGTLDKIEEIEYEVTNNMVEIFASLFDLIESGRNDQTEAIVAIEGVRNKAASSVKIAYHSIFSAIKILFKAHSSQIPAEGENVLFTTESARSLVSSVIKDEVWNKYALIRILFIFSLADENGLLIDFSAIQSSEKDILTAYKAAFEPIFSILYKLTGTEDISSEIETAQDQVFSGLQAANNAFFEAIAIIQIENSSAITTDGSAIDDSIHGVVASILDAIVKANSSGKLAEIEGIEKTVTSEILAFHASVYEIIVSVSSPEDEVVAAIESVKQKAISYLEITFRALFAPIKIIAAQDSSEPRSRSERISLAIKTAEIAVFFNLRNEVVLQYALLRNLHTVNSLNNNEIMIHFSPAVIT